MEIYPSVISKCLAIESNSIGRIPNGVKTLSSILDFSAYRNLENLIYYGDKIAEMKLEARHHSHHSFT
jgi:hypothetical protein